MIGRFVGQNGCSSIHLFIMGQLLFLTYINDLPEAASSSARLFADDCLLFRRIRKIQDAVDLQNDLS
jgi:hypothetical protein